jgi:hypothetical protein
MNSGAERSRRAAVFRANLRRYAMLNAQALRAAQAAGVSPEDAPTYGLTDFSHLTEQEFRSLYLSRSFGQLKGRVSMADASSGTAVVASSDGLSASAVDAGAAAAAADLTGARRRLHQETEPVLQCKKQLRTFPFSKVTPPASLDWRNVNGTSFVAPVRNQASCGSCAAFASVVTLEAVGVRRALLAKNGARGLASAGKSVSATYNLSEQDLLDCWDPTTDECEGALPSWYLDRATCKGIATEAAVPYKARDANVCAGVARDTLGLSGWYEPPTTDLGLKQAIAKAPVAIAIYAENSFSGYRGGVMPCGTPGNYKDVNHAISAIGWDSKSFLVKNSWGPSWGEGGYVRLASGCAKGKSTLNMHTPGYNVGVTF